MVGWTILFGLISLCGVVLTFSGAAYLFGLLFLLSLLTHLIRGSAR